MTYVSVLIIEHPPGISQEGAIKQRNDADKAVEATGLIVRGADTGPGDAAALAMYLVRVQEQPPYTESMDDPEDES